MCTGGPTTGGGCHLPPILAVPRATHCRRSGCTHSPASSAPSCSGQELSLQACLELPGPYLGPSLLTLSSSPLPHELQTFRPNPTADVASVTCPKSILGSPLPGAHLPTFPHSSTPDPGAPLDPLPHFLMTSISRSSLPWQQLQNPTASHPLWAW